MNKSEILQKRSQLLRQLRAFFYERDVIEVDTPNLSCAATPDVHLRSVECQVRIPGEASSQTFYLHTSPEYPMKRLLCEGVGDCFYLGKVFRDGDLSPRHQVEFTMLEWYRLGFSMQNLIDEVVELIILSLHREGLIAEQLTYQQMFHRFADIEDIATCDSAICRAVLSKHNIPEIVGVEDDDKTLWEQLVLTEVIEPKLGKDCISVITHFPARDAALAQVDGANPDTALRFEIFVDGMELANGYQELAEANEYRLRFEESNRLRAEYGFSQMPLDENLLQTLAEKSLPDCSGVALGFDRLFLLQQGFKTIEQGIGFGIKNA